MLYFFRTLALPVRTAAAHQIYTKYNVRAERIFSLSNLAHPSPNFYKEWLKAETDRRGKNIRPDDSRHVLYFDY